MQKILLFLLAFCLPLLASAQSSVTRYVGGDISLLPTYEETGVKYLDENGGTVSDLVSWLKTDTVGWNAMRVRLFHNPSNADDEDKGEGVRQDLDYVTSLCQRIKAAGYALMLDIHYSDTWTDPLQHSTPEAWDSTDPTVLADSVYEYTKMVLNHLVNANATPDWIQVGNEVNGGMMWPTGHCSATGGGITSSDGVAGTWANFVSYLQAGVKACREVLPDAKIVIHTSMDREGATATSFYSTLSNYDVDYDIIGLSYYPDYHGSLSALNSTISTFESKYSDKEIMIVETGYGAQYALNGTYSSTVQETWEISEDGQLQFTNDLITELLKHDSVTGLFWWLPEDNEYGVEWPNYARSSGWWSASLYKQDAGTPWAAMYELKNFIASNPTGIAAVTTDAATPAAQQGLYTIQGQRVSQPNGRNVYIQNGRKVLINNVK